MFRTAISQTRREFAQRREAEQRREVEQRREAEERRKLHAQRSEKRLAGRPRWQSVLDDDDDCEGCEDALKEDESDRECFDRGPSADEGATMRSEGEAFEDQQQESEREWQPPAAIGLDKSGVSFWNFANNFRKTLSIERTG